jgi:hypothetical protein
MSPDPTHDYNTADVGGGSFELIPADTIAKVALAIRPGGEGEGGWLTQSKSSDAQYLNCEFVVLEGPYDKRKFWGNLTVTGGKVNEDGSSIAGNITRATLRAILESARNVRPDDENDAAKRTRLVNGYGDFNGMEFWARVGIEPARDQYAAKNKLAGAITPDKPEYGKSTDGAVQAGGGAASTETPAWASGQQAAQAAEQSNAPAWAQK